MRPRNGWLWGIWLVLGMVGFHAQAQEIPVQVVDASGRVTDTVSVVPHEGTYYFSIDTLFSLFDPNGKQRYVPLTRRLTLQLRDKRFDLAVTRTRGSVEGTPFQLEHPVWLDERGGEDQPRILVPLEFLTEVVAPALDQIVDFNPSAQRLQIRAKEVVSPLESPPITAQPAALVLDPGHGGGDTGVVVEGLSEKSLVLQIAQKAQQMASKLGVPVLLTRSDDRAVPVLERAQEAVKSGGKIFVSLHADATFGTSHSGVRLYLHNPQGELRVAASPASAVDSKALALQEVSQVRFLTESRRLAMLLQTQLQAQLGLEEVEIHELPLVPLAQVMMPAVLVEVGALDHPDDRQRLNDPQQQEALAQAIVQAARQYLNPQGDMEGAQGTEAIR